MATPKTPSKSARATGRANRRYVSVNVVNVYLWGQHLGAVALDSNYGYYTFNYTSEFRQSGIEPTPLHMPAAGGPYIFTDLDVATWRRLPAMLSDALPDDFGNALIDRYMAERGLAKESVTALDRLAYMGSRSMGALEFRPARGPVVKQATSIEMGDLVEKARMAVRGTIEEEPDASKALQSIIDVGTSAGGARAKAVIALNRETHEIRSGQFDAPEGFEHWLLKFDGMGEDKELGSSQAYGRIEYAYHLMAIAAGIEMMPCELLEEGGRAHFMTKRFDREGGNVKHHMQTLCAMDHLSYKLKGTNSYAALFLVLDKLGLPYEAGVEVFRRMAFNVMARNCDDHTKNFSFRMRKGHRWELAPAYDVTFAHNPKGEWTNQHLMSVNEKFKDLTEADLLAMANRFDVGTPGRVIEKVRAALRHWPEFAAKAGVPQPIADEIGRQHLFLLPSE
jgi:serine/threonine-protein kinase HipA